MCCELLNKISRNPKTVIMAGKSNVVSPLRYKRCYTHQVMPASSLHTSVWVTDMACLPRFHFLVFATTARDIQFYDTNANRFERLSRVTGLNACPTALSFHESRWSIAKLMWGDQVYDHCMAVCRHVVLS